MKKILYSAAMLLMLVLPFGCKPTQSTVVTKEVVTVDTVKVSEPKYAPDPRPYRASYTRRNDLIHTKLDVRFDWQKQYLYGKATLRLRPLFYPTDSLELDAKGFTVNKVAIVTPNGESPLKYDYNQRKIKIKLDRTYRNTEEYSVFIDYVAKPNELPLGGSNAITADKGLYFINPLGEDINKPKQIWTQGETESSSCWFPTIDKSNERCTDEIYMTVEDKYKTLSNGILKSSTKNPDGTRTDYWVMDKPHAPYLFMMAVGEFTVVEDNWNGMPIYYYVEPKYGPYAKQIYNNTPEILQFFSDRLGVKYPWQKMAHIIVRDYVSGAMENTTAIIYGEFCQKTDRELEDDNNDGILAHEMFHHWFGDYVTCESWSNLSLNESFANYSEYLWAEHKYGKDEADNHRYEDMGGYMGQAANQIHELIDFHYNDKEDMFDGHSYNKGGCILHMLRNYLGDDAFFASLKLYLERNALTATEAHQLRLAFEEVSGEDLNWFFNQWYFSPGHPNLNISYDYDGARHKALVTIEQTQDLNTTPIFRLPIAVDVYTGPKPVRHKIVVSKQIETFELDCPNEPKLINVDADKILLCEKTDAKGKEEYIFQFNNAKQYLDRRESLEGLRYFQDSDPAAKKVFADAMGDPFWGIRAMAIKQIELSDNEKDKQYIATIARLAETDPKSQVRAAAFEKLAELGSKSYTALAGKAFDKDRSYLVIGSALNYLNTVDPTSALQYADKLKDIDSDNILMTVAELYSATHDVKYLPFFEKAFTKVNGYSLLQMFSLYGELLSGASAEDASKGAQKLYGFATDKSVSLWGRFGATNGINNLRKAFSNKASSESDATKKQALQDKAKEMKDLINDIKSKEKDPQLTKYYNNF